MTDGTTQMDPLILIKRVIDKAGIDGTLTENAAKYFNDKLTQNKEMKTKISTLETMVESRTEKIATLEASNNRLMTENTEWQKRETELETREDEMLRLELTAQFEAERVTDHKEMFGQVFRNIEVRRDIFTAYPGSDGGQYQTPIAGGVEHNVETTKTE